MAEAVALRRCEDCGFTSAGAAGFQRRGGGLRRTRELCGSCTARADERAARRALLRLTLLWPTAGLLCLLGHWIVAAPEPESFGSRLGWAILNLWLSLVALALAAPVHEAGHAALFRLVGWRVHGVTLGQGPILYERVLDRTRLRVQAWPWDGMTLAAPWPGSPPRLVRLRWLAGIAGGPLANLLLLLLGWRLLEPGERVFHGPAPGWALLAANGWVLALNLFPRRGPSYPNDGWQLLTVPFANRWRLAELGAASFLAEGHSLEARGRLAEAVRWAEEAVAAYPDAAQPRFSLGFFLVYAGELARAQACFAEALRQPDLTSELLPLAQNNLAWSIAARGLREALGEADELSRQAYERLGWQAAIAGTRGAVLVEQGRLEEGLELLERALARPEELVPMARASYLCSRAMALAALGRASEGAALMAEAEGLEPRCPFLPRARAACA